VNCIGEDAYIRIMDETGDVSKDRLYDQCIKLTEESIIQYLCHTSTKASEAKINPGLKHIYTGIINIILNTKQMF
jgi:hypothetical protein